MKLIIAGTRSFNNPFIVERELSGRSNITEVVSGTARGADQCGEEWAKRHNIPVTKFPADWKQYGKIAGFMRNIEMAEYADSLVAFWDGKSPGTWNMIQQMAKRGKEYTIVNYLNYDNNSV